MMKRWLAAVIGCMLLLTGCGEKAAAPADPAPDPPQPPPGQEVVENDALTSFRQEIGDESAVLAVAYLGYAELNGYGDLAVYLEANGFCDLYPVLAEMTQAQFVQREGGEVYLVVPVSADTALSVFDCAVDETAYDLVRGEKLLSLEAGQPVILQGNVSEIVSNLWVTAETAGGDPFEYTPCLSLMDGSLAKRDGVYDCSDYDHIRSVWSGAVEEVPVFCSTWYAQTVDGDGSARSMKLSLGYDGTAEYSYGIPESVVLESFEGCWFESGGVLTLELYGGPGGYEGEGAAEFAYDKRCSFNWENQGRHLMLSHMDGDALLYGAEGAVFDFLPFDSYLLAGTWSAAAPVRDWSYDLSLQEDGTCLFKISEADRELALYEGLWFMTEEFYISLDLELTSGQHPENPEMTHLSGTYLAERNENTMDLSFVSGGILTLGMEEHGWDAFAMFTGDSCVSVHYASDLGIAWDDYDWVIVDDTVPVEAVFCTMVPVENFKVVSLFLQGDGAEMDFDVTELFDYGTLTPEMPLCVILTDHGSIPGYGVSFTDPSTGAERLFGVGISGMDGSLELTEIRS